MTVLADRIIPLGNYGPGTIEVGFGPGRGGNPLVVPDGTKTCDFQIAKCTSQDLTIWPDPNVFLDINPEISIDNAVTWIPGGASGHSPGGIQLGKDGVSEVPFLVTGGSLPEPKPGISRLYRCKFIITGGVLRSFGSVLVD